MELNVLVVDDSAVMRAMIIKTLGLSGLPLGEIHQAGNGAEALEVINEAVIDLALVDLNMPVMNGEELIEELRSRVDTHELPVVVVSTEGSFTRIAMLRSKGAEFVHKPFTPEALRETVLETLGGNINDYTSGCTLPSSGTDF